MIGLTLKSSLFLYTHTHTHTREAYDTHTPIRNEGDTIFTTVLLLDIV
jgi:hypothetical protein